MTDARTAELLAGINILRGLTLVWAFAVAVIDARSGVMSHLLVGFAMLAAMAVWTVATTTMARATPSPLARTPVIVIDVLGAATVVSMDWFLYDGTHPVSFGSAWPLGAVITAGVVRGAGIGAGAGVVVGSAGVLGAASTDRLDGRLMALSGTIVLFAVAGAVSGWLAGRLRSAESEVAMARARDQVARTLHDGVLQTLAVIQRRGSDPELVTLARDQERELRSFLESGPVDGWPRPRVAAMGATKAGRDVAPEIRRVAGVVERRHGVRVDVVVIDACTAPAPTLDALAGAAGEALNNAAKYAHATRITASVDVDETGSGVVVAIVDDGVGFDPEAPTTGTGLERSVRGRIAEVGGRVTVRSKPGIGTEVEIWVPAR